MTKEVNTAWKVSGGGFSSRSLLQEVLAKVPLHDPTLLTIRMIFLVFLGFTFHYFSRRKYIPTVVIRGWYPSLNRMIFIISALNGI